MLYLLIKTGLSAIIIAAISEIGKRSPGFAALVASLPLVSILGMIWLWCDTHDLERLAVHSQATFWYVLPSLPMFLILSVLLRHNVGFYPAMFACILITIALYLGMIVGLRRFGIIL